jgi:hypothetical protein
MQGDDGWAKMKVIQMRHEIQLFCQKNLRWEFFGFFHLKSDTGNGGKKNFLMVSDSIIHTKEGEKKRRMLQQLHIFQRSYQTLETDGCG